MFFFNSKIGNSKMDKNKCPKSIYVILELKKMFKNQFPYIL